MDIKIWELFVFKQYFKPREWPTDPSRFHPVSCNLCFIAGIKLHVMCLNISQAMSLMMLIQFPLPFRSDVRSRRSYPSMPS